MPANPNRERATHISRQPAATPESQPVSATESRPGNPSRLHEYAYRAAILASVLLLLWTAA